MKQHLLRCLALLLLAAMTLSLCACFDGGLFGKGEDDGAENGGVADKYGFARPETCWLSENLLFTEQPALTDLFGTAGESGLAAEAILAGEGQILPSQKNYLACLYYGSLPYADMQIRPYLEFTVVNGTQILRGNECVKGVRVISWTGDLASPSVAMNQKADSRLSFENPGKNVMQGAFVIEYTPTVSEGMMVVELCMYLDHNVEGVPDPTVGWEQLQEHYWLDYSDNVLLGTQSGDPPVYMTLSTAYLTEQDYNDGDFSDENFHYIPNFDGGQYCYLVVDYFLMANRDGYGGDTVQIMVYIPSRGVLDLYLERAPTSSTEKVTIDKGLVLCATVTVPNTIEETKEGRIVVRLTAVGSGNCEIGVLAYAGPKDKVDGHPYVRESVNSNEVFVKYNLSTDFSFYTASWERGTSPIAVEIPDLLYGDTPVTAIPVQGFYECTSLESVTLGKNIKRIGDIAFAGCKNLTTLHYHGTMEQWGAVELGFNWNQGTGLTQVICEDGTVPLQ